MGDLLQFPGSRGGSDEQEPFDGAQDRGVERSSAPSRHPSRGTKPLPPRLQQSLEDIERQFGRGRADQGAVDSDSTLDAPEPRWAVPGVDDTVPAPAEPTRASKRAENVALAALTRHDASEGEIRAKLVAKGLDEEDVEGELARLRRAGLVDDTAFATRLLDRLRERKGLGDQAIRSSLRGRLVPQEVIDAVLLEQTEDEDVAADRLQEVADDRARRLGSLDRAVAERRLTAYLMRKGYSGSSVRSAVRAALDSVGIR